MFSIGTGEIVLIIIIAILVFGPKRIPEMAKTAGKILADLKRTTNDFKQNLEKEIGVDKLEDLHPRKIARDLMREIDIKESDIIDLHPGYYNSKDMDDDIYEGSNDDSQKTAGSEEEKSHDTIDGEKNSSSISDEKSGEKEE